MEAARDAGAPELAADEYRSAEEMMALTDQQMEEETYDEARLSALRTRDLAEVATSVAGRRREERQAEAAARTANGTVVAEGAFNEAEVAREVSSSTLGEGSLPGSGVRIEALDSCKFEFDTAGLSDGCRELLQRHARYLLQRPTLSVRLEGHTDERGSTEYNLALGEERATSVKSYLSDLGVPNNRLEVVTFGEEAPIDPRTTEDAWAQNRRVEFVVNP